VRQFFNGLRWTQPVAGQPHSFTPQRTGDVRRRRRREGHRRGRSRPGPPLRRPGRCHFLSNVEVIRSDYLGQAAA